LGGPGYYLNVLLGGNQLVKLIADKLKSTLLARDLLDVSRQTINGHHLEQMIKLLLHHGDLDRKFVAALMEQLLSVCRSQKSDAFYAFAGPVTSIIASLLSSYLYEVWHEVSKVITSADSLVRFYAERLFDPPHEHHLAPGLLHGLPPEVYVDWVRKAPDARAEVVMKWLPITTVRSDGTSTWSPDLEAYISEFGDQPRVLVGLARRLHPRSWWGSVAPHLEPFLPLLEMWTRSHPRPEVRRWAQGQIEHIGAEIEAGRKEDEERGAGIY
jgi:hypothetical protein